MWTEYPVLDAVLKRQDFSTAEKGRNFTLMIAPAFLKCSVKDTALTTVRQHIGWAGPQVWAFLAVPCSWPTSRSVQKNSSMEIQIPHMAQHLVCLAKRQSFDHPPLSRSHYGLSIINLTYSASREDASCLSWMGSYLSVVIPGQYMPVFGLSEGSWLVTKTTLAPAHLL